MNSPLSESPADKIRDISRDYILDSLAGYFHSKPPVTVVETDYSLWRCQETGIEFCAPNIAGNTEFYAWISSFKSYYPGYRWEYGVVRKLVKRTREINTNFKILDVGSGNGDFLNSLDYLNKEQLMALDLNESAVAACRKSGIKAFCSTVEDAIKKGIFRKGEFAVVTSFHCLEHISDPVSFVKELLNATKAGGKLFLSTPYSPMSFESEWFDVMNHPPHHMTRWNLKAYEKLAEICNVKMRYFCPRILPFRQIFQTFHLAKYGVNHSPSVLRFGIDLIHCLPMLLEIWKKNSDRVRNSGVHGSDLILVEFTAR